MIIAAAALLDGAGAFAQDCKACQTDPDLRLAYGCDGPTACATAQFEHECQHCHGQQAKCSACNGSGVTIVRRCPWQLIESVHVELIRATLAVEEGFLPAAGGWHDQAHTFAEAYWRLARPQLAAHRERARKRAEKANR